MLCSPSSINFLPIQTKKFLPCRRGQMNLIANLNGVGIGFQLRVSYMGEKTVVVSITCSKRTDTMVKLCEVFESLKLKIITANITAFSGRLLKTVFVEVSLPPTLPYFLDPFFCIFYLPKHSPTQFSHAYIHFNFESHRPLSISFSQPQSQNRNPPPFWKMNLEFN